MAIFLSAILLIAIISCFGGLMAAIWIGLDGNISVRAITAFIVGALIWNTVHAIYPYGTSHFTDRSKLSTSETGTFYGVSDHISMKDIKFDVGITEFFKESGELEPKIRYLIVDNRVFVMADKDIIYLPNVSAEELYEEFPLARPKKGDK